MKFEETIKYFETEILNESFSDKVAAILAAGTLGLSTYDAEANNQHKTNSKHSKQISTNLASKKAKSKHVYVKSNVNLDKLISALMKIEVPSGNPLAVGDQGRAVGILQLHTEMVDDVNRILGKKVYSYEDRKNPEKSKEMAKIYFRSRLKHNPAFDYEHLARQWNGGPSGHMKTATIQYWKKVKNVL